jgi:hypothetical protein
MSGGFQITTISTPSGVDLNLNPTAANINHNAAQLYSVPSTISGGKITIIPINFQQTGNTLTTNYTFATSSGTQGTAYVFRYEFTYMGYNTSTTGKGIGLASGFYTVQNLVGTLTMLGPFTALISNPATVPNANFSMTTSGTNVLIQTQGSDPNDIINWCGRLEVTQQSQ